MIIRQNNKVGASLLYLLIMLSLLSLATMAGYLSRTLGFPETNIVVFYLLAVLLTARFSKGYIYGIVSSALSIFAYNYFFTQPYFTFIVNDPSDLVTFVIMTIMALLTSALTSHVKKSAVEAQEKEAEAKALYELTYNLSQASNIHDIALIALKSIGDILKCEVCCLCLDEKGHVEKKFIQQISPERQICEDVTNSEDMFPDVDVLHKGYSVGTEFYDCPISGSNTPLGIIRIPAKNAAAMTDPQMRVLASMIESTALAMDRIRLAQQHLKSREEAIRERYRSNLLRAISHDLRTPLSGIMGTSEMLMGMTNHDDPRYNLAEDIHSDADWLHSLVENILSLTRLQDGGLVLNKQPEAVEEVVGGAVGHIQKRLPKQEIIIDIPKELFLVPMDAKLIVQVIINLLENAIKHTPEKGEISVTVYKDEQINCAVFIVADKGEGIAPDHLPNIFQMFYTSGSRKSDHHNGVGLGLAICDAIVKAHGGDIEAHNRFDGQGAEFKFTLPLEVSENG